MNRPRKHGERGATIFEAVVVICILFLAFFGLLQIYQWCIDQLFCQYSAFYTARGVALGYRPNMVLRGARVAAIGISGAQTGGRRAASIYAEEENAERYMQKGDTSGVRYAYWDQNSSRSNPYLYMVGTWSSSGSGAAAGKVRLENAPLLSENLAKPLSIKRNPEPEATVRYWNFSSVFLED